MKLSGLIFLKSFDEIMNTINKTLSLLAFCIAIFSIAGCASIINDLKKRGSQYTPAQQVTNAKAVKTVTPSKSKVAIKKIRSDCSYIVRDLSSHNAKDIWCIPRALQ